MRFVLLFSFISYHLNDVFASNSSLMRSQTYAKVAKWGAMHLPSNSSEGRSNRGQTFYTQRSDVNLRIGQYLDHQKAKVGIPVKKHGFQDRFNPPPIFAFNGGESKPTYDSPITSYNPAPSGIPQRFQFTGPTFPPNLAPVYKGPAYTFSETTESPNAKKPIAPSPIYGPLDLPGDSSSNSTLHHESDINNESNLEQSFPHEEYPLEESPEEDYKPNRYEYDDHDHFHYEPIHHHRHHEMMKPLTTTTTTTTEAPGKEEKRVNKGHYSYYYLGRKLYYVPLYFSVYFIIYVTVLILKSISRHKVNFAHDLHEAASNRNLHVDYQDVLEDVTERAQTAINGFAKRYTAM